MVKIVRLFTVSAGIALGATSVFKIASAFGSQAILSQADPIIGLPFRKVMLIVGLLEATIAASCLLTKSYNLNAMLVAWLTTCFATYRVGLWLINWRRPCHCLGNLTDAIHISPQAADTLVKIILFYLLVGSYTILFWLWRYKHKSFSGTLFTSENSTDIAL